jgi:hypothetical protein
MSSEHKEAQYRGFAASCLDLAKSSPTFAEKTRLLAMAEAWLNLVIGLRSWQSIRSARSPIIPWCGKPWAECREQRRNNCPRPRCLEITTRLRYPEPT